MAEIFDIEAVRRKIEQLMERDKIARKPLAKAAGLGETSIRDLWKPDRSDVQASTLVKLAEFFDVTVDELAGRADVPLLGRIGAGAAIAWEEESEAERVPRPPLALGPLMALQVVGDSMLPRYDPGQIIYVRRDHQGVLPEYIGQYCAVALTDGGVFLKILAAGTEPGRYTLRSLNAADMANVEVLWASPVVFVWTPAKPNPSA